MSKQNSKGSQTSQYDKIIKENLEVTLPVIIREMLGLDIKYSEELPDDIQHTKERKPDALKKVTDLAGNTYILHVEFQIADEMEMVYRMAEYCVMLMRKYKLPVKQFVIFLKDALPIMPAFINAESLQFKYDLLRISEASYKLFLKSDSPEVKMLGILANFEKEDIDGVIRLIIDEVQSINKGDFAESRFFNQLRIFVQLRGNIEQQFQKAMETISKFFKEEQDYLYRKGEEKGREKEQFKVVTNLISELGLPDEQVARIAGVSVNFVKSVREGFNK